MKNVLNFPFVLFLISFISCNEDDDKKMRMGYSGNDISHLVEVVRDAETKNVVLNVKTNEVWELYAGLTAENIDVTRAVLSGASKGEFDVNVEPDKRYIFQFQTIEGQAFVSEKHLPIKGGYNFRDMGGIKNKENRFVRWGLLFRTDEMNKLTEADLSYIASTGLQTVFDFRTVSEKEGGMEGMMPPAPDKLPASVKNVYELPIAAGNIFSEEMIDRIRMGATQEELTEVMKNTYRELVGEDEYVKCYKEFFSYLQNKDYIPVSYHCSAGKDRTGVAAMLIYSALDVDKEIIMEDYMLSKQYIAGKYDSYLKIYPQIAPLVTIREEYLEAAYEMIEQKHGNMNKFLTEVLDIDISKMKELYLY